MGRAIALAAALSVLLFAGASAQSGCTAAIVGLAPCLSYIVGSTSSPASSCCTQLAGVAGSQPQCLCMALNGGAAQLGVIGALNQTRALGLPAACKVQAPPVSQCSAAAGAPGGSPAPSSPKQPPSPSAPAEPSSPTTSPPNITPPGAGRGSKTEDGRRASAGGRSATPALLPSSLLLLSVASCALNPAGWF